MSERVWVTLKEAAAATGATTGQLRQALNRGTLRGRHIGAGRGGIWLVRIEDVQRYFAEKPPAGPDRRRGKPQPESG